MDACDRWPHESKPAVMCTCRGWGGDWYKKVQQHQACHLRSFNTAGSLFLTPVSASQVVSSARRLKNLPCPSAASFIKLPLLPKTGQRIPEGLVYFLLQQRSERPCRPTELSLTTVPQPPNIYVCAACCRPWGLTKRRELRIDVKRGAIESSR